MRRDCGRPPQERRGKTRGHYSPGVKAFHRNISPAHGESLVGVGLDVHHQPLVLPEQPDGVVEERGAGVLRTAQKSGGGREGGKGGKAEERVERKKEGKGGKRTGAK